MIHAVITGLIATVAFAAFYWLMARIEQSFTPHYYEVAHHPELATPLRMTASRISRLVFLYGLLGWVAEVSHTAKLVVGGWPMILAFLGYIGFLVLAGAALLLIVWQAYRLNAEFVAIAPEFMIAVMLCGYTAFAISSKAWVLWEYLPGLRYFAKLGAKSPCCTVSPAVLSGLHMPHFQAQAPLKSAASFRNYGGVGSGKQHQICNKLSAILDGILMSRGLLPPSIAR